MAYQKQTYLTCDGCQKKHGYDDRCMSWDAKELRLSARMYSGWTYHREKDYCKECTARKKVAKQDNKHITVF